jgi:hypothetical protein
MATLQELTSHVMEMLLCWTLHLLLLPLNPLRPMLTVTWRQQQQH